MDLNLSQVSQGRVGIIVNELGNNLVKYAKSGRLLFRVLDGNNLGIEVLSVDKGPGLPNTAQALSDGFSTGSTPGTGLGAVRRQADYFDIFSEMDKGTLIVAGVFSESGVPLPSFSIGAINVPVKGEIVAGDAWRLHENHDSFSLLVVDGLGHGPFANQAALEAVSVFESNLEDSLDQLLVRIHGRLKSTRGAAVFLLRALKDRQLQFTGVGNIRGLVQYFDRSKALISQNGTAGVQMRTARVLIENWDSGGVVILHSDGIGSRWDLSQYKGLLHRHPSIIAAALYRDFNRGTDDSTVVVIGRSP